MAIARIAVRTHSRSRGHSVAAAWAYRSGQRFVCSRTGEEHDYRPRWGSRGREVRTGIAWTRTMKEGPSIARDEQTLIDAIESAERRKDATILRDIQLALADELPTEELPELIEEMAQELADEYHTIAMWVMHPPEPRGDGRNVHAHILLATRELAPKGDGFAGKLRILDGRKTGPGEIVKLRNAWCAKTNARLERAGSGARIYPGRRLDAPPMPTIPRRYIARTHKRAARRERIAARREGRKTVPIRMRVAELATLGKPANRAMGEIAKHVAAGYDVPVSEREYAKTARTRYERAEEYDRAQRDASHYESLPFVREELASAHGKLEEVEARIGELRAARALDSVGPEAIASAAAVALVGPSVIEDAAGESELKLAARTDLKLAGARDGVRPVAFAPVPVAPLMAPPAAEDDGAEREPEFKRRGASVLDAGGGPARPEPIVAVAGTGLEVPRALPDDGRGPDLEESVEYLVEFYGAVDRMARELIDDYSDRFVFADLVEEAMRYQIREAPASAPRLAGIPRDAEANRQCVIAWSKALRPEMNELVRLGADHERIEQHITTVCERAQDDDAWREPVLAEFTRLIAGAYVMDFVKVQLEDADRAGLEARRVVKVRLAEQLAEGGIDAWSEQTVARAAGLDVDWRFGGLARSRASGLNAEDTLRLVLYELIRIARTLKRTFPGSSAELGRAATAGEWYGRLQHVMSEVRRFVSEPKMRQKLIDLTAASMLPDLRLEQSSAGSARELAERAPPTLAERDRALRELARQRAREAGVDDDLDAPRERGGAGRESSGGARGEQVEALPEPAPRTANAELERRIREEFEEQARRDRAAERKRTEDYGAPAVRLASEFLRLHEEHGELEVKFTANDRSTGTLEFIDRDGNSRYSERASGVTFARMDALLAGRPPEDIPELEREITLEIALELARLRGRDR